MAENGPEEEGDEGGDDECDDESVLAVLHAVDEVHAEEAGHEGGEHEHNRHRGEGTHHGVHVVVDDARVGVHGRLEDVAVDVRRLAGLTHLDVYVFYQVGVQLVDLQLEFQFRQQVLVAAYGGDEIGERVLQTAQADKALVVDVVVEIALGLLDEAVDLFEPFQIPDGRGEEKAENHVHVIGESLAAFLLVTHEVDHHVGLIVAHGDGDVAFVDDTERHGGVGCARAYLLDVGYTEDNEHPAVVVLITGTLVGIADVGKKVVGYLETLLQHGPVLIGRTSHLNPAIGLPFLNGGEPFGSIPICLHKPVSLLLLGRIGVRGRPLKRGLSSTPVS